MARKPAPGADDGTWGDILNEYLGVNHNASGKNVFTQVGTGAVERLVEDKFSEVVSVKDFGATGDDTTIAEAGLDITTVQTETGQSWLQSTDSMDLAAYYLARASAGTTGTVYFPDGDYVFTAPGFVTRNVLLNPGATITNTRTDATRFVFSNRVFLMGIFAREDWERFTTQGWEHTADTVAAGGQQLTSFSGTLPSPGDVLLIRTTVMTGTLPDYTTLNEVRSVVGTTVNLRYPMEKGMVDPVAINYSTITTLKSDLVSIGEPHRYFASQNLSVRGGTLIATDGAAFQFNAALNCTIETQIIAIHGQAVYGNGLNRCRVDVSGVCGGPKGAVELGIGSARSRVNVDVQYSGDDTHSSSGVSGTYPHIQLGEYTEGCSVTGKLDMGDKPSNSGVTFPTSSHCKVNVDMVAYKLSGQAVVFPSNAGTGNRVSGSYDIGPADETIYYAAWNGGIDGWLENASFAGEPIGISGLPYSLYFAASNLGGARGVVAPEGVLRLGSGTVGNKVISTHIEDGIQSGGALGNQVEITTGINGSTLLGRWPDRDLIGDYANLSSTLNTRDCFGKTVQFSGQTATRQFALPVSVSGMVIRVFRANATWATRVRPNAAEIIGSGGVGKYLELQSDGAWAELRCFAPGVWVIAASSGTIGYEP